ncbi:MAG: GlxA family transcriptional regulator [Marinovum algicola]|jgi:transcriptional regulator GlxA family with amidase domain|uniref:Transcriptional regulator, AraC family with amidase-like domain n=1 Tax=Marinovum algicola TaxID=42444 RepID=A0A975W7Z9_9RHOB|nr:MULTISPECIES: GlxA family transcriptional regulator [Marinovum]MDD9743335.1 GlxA family transcriptional regulator [Marinovum sp. PR37]SEI90791.1 transcriptional regulator, AraC family with amidase-like domain [Marinovum algicola]SLN12456.1 HTH-type transcriptional regulator CdhR [Marinovum algicola]
MAAQHFVFLLVEDHTHLTLACAIEPLRIANLISGRDLYAWSYASEDGISSRASNGSVTLVAHGFGAVPRADRLFVISGLGMTGQITPALLAALRRARSTGVRIGALCSGAWVLAQAGFLDGMKAAIHWEYHDAFAERFPEVALERCVFVADEKHVTASGGSATADLMLHLIERDHGYDLSVAVSDMMVYAGAREAGVAQRISLQSRHGMRNPHVARAIEIMRGALEEPVSPMLIAQDLGISVRQLERLFGRYFNTSPGRYYMELRLDRARHLLLQTEMSVSEIAVACGFQSLGHFTRLYRRSFGISPSGQRGRIA